MRPGMRDGAEPVDEDTDRHSSAKKTTQKHENGRHNSSKKTTRQHEMNVTIAPQ